MKVIRKEDETLFLLPYKVLRVNGFIDNKTLRKMKEESILVINAVMHPEWFDYDEVTYDEREVEIV
ncbi:hypothetical protein V7122_19795 [Bacillus sp. JJ1532]|uniref:hypothetical protein n=1 Tax=Bacillus sp. JJ1532 TaxID=3122958 RepID=UPI002FFFBBD0